MRAILLAGLLLACDQGAKPAPAPQPSEVELGATMPLALTGSPSYVIRDQADFIAKASRVVDELISVFVQGGKNCDVVAGGIVRFRDTNRTRFDALMRYSKSHPEAEKALQAAMQDRMNDFTSKLMPTMQACAGHKGLIDALQSLAELQQEQ